LLVHLDGSLDRTTIIQKKKQMSGRQIDSLDSVDSRELKGGWGGGERELSPLSLFHNLGYALDESEFEP
jgi:hypothetical protein